MLKELLIAAGGSFLGGGMRFLASRWIQALAATGFPFATLGVNVLGCFLIGLLSGLPSTGVLGHPGTKLFLTTGFCGGFTTFSTFMNESSSLMKDENYVWTLLYMMGSLALGMVAVWAGNFLTEYLR